MLVNYQEKVRVAGDNVDSVLRELNITGPEQIAMIKRILVEKSEAIISRYNFVQSPGDRRGDLTVFHDLGKAAISFGTDIQMGDWDETYEIITLDNGEKYYVDGKAVYLDDDGACSLGNI